MTRPKNIPSWYVTLAIFEIAASFHYLKSIFFTISGSRSLLKGQSAFWYLGGGRGSSHQLQHTRRFVRYCIYGWGAPAIVVSTFVIIDQFISKGFVGYGEFRPRKDLFNIFVIGTNRKPFVLFLTVAIQQTFTFDNYV